ncbi:MAG: EpsG family protein [Fibrobacter sp.]|nr:EpsG family protein [Fibrobacter sp.]
MIDLLIYLAVFIGATLFLNFRQENDKTINVTNIIGLIAIIIFAAGRYHVGTDSGTYMRIFERFGAINWSDFFHIVDSDYIFALLIKLTYPLGGRVLTWGTVAALTAIPAYLALRKEYPKVSVTVAFTIFLFSYYAIGFNVARQMIAVAICFYGLKFIFANNLLPFFLTTIIALGFHSSAIIVLPMWFLWDHKNNSPIDGNKRFFIIFATAIVCAGYQKAIDLFTGGFDYYESYGVYAVESTRGQNRDIYIYILELFLILSFKEKLKALDSRIGVMIDLLTISVLIGLTGFYHPQVKRLAYYYAMPARMILFGYLSSIFANDRSQQIIKISTIIWFVAQFILIVYILKQANLIPYHFNLTKPW